MSKPSNALLAPASAPLLRTQKFQSLFSQLLSTAVDNQLSTASWLPLHGNRQLWQEMLAIQQAVMQRMQQQHQAWIDGCADVSLEYRQLKKVNTLSKLIEQEYNIMAQWHALIASQMSNWAGLLENIHVDYAYWLSQKQAQAWLRSHPAPLLPA